MTKTFKTDLGILYHADCFDIMEGLIETGIKVDMILADLPYGTTQNKWDIPLDLVRLWECYDALITDNGAIIMTAQTPFDKILGASNIKLLRYEWIWEKTRHTGHLNSKRMPLKNHENILVFYKHLPTYNPQFTDGKPYTSLSRGAKGSTNYNPQEDRLIVNDGFRYPLSIQKFGHDTEKLHPTQKPLNLFKYMIKTYTHRNDLVLDNVAGSGTTPVACEELGRRWIAIENKKKYFDITVKRIRSM